MSGPNKQPMYPFRAPAELLDACKDAAAEAGESLAEWLREAAQQRLDRRQSAKDRVWFIVETDAKKTKRRKR